MATEFGLDGPGCRGAKRAPALSTNGVAVFDLDDTLVAGDSFGCFLRQRILGNPVRLAGALATAPLWILTLMLAPVRVLAERHLIWIATAGLDATA